MVEHIFIAIVIPHHVVISEATHYHGFPNLPFINSDVFKKAIFHPLTINFGAQIVMSLCFQ